MAQSLPMRILSKADDDDGTLRQRTLGGSRKYSVDLMREMPSRQIEDLSQQRPSQYATLRLRSATVGSHKSTLDPETVYELLKKDEESSPDQIKETLREMHQTLTLKRIVKAKLQEDEEKQKKRHKLSWWRENKYKMEMAFEEVMYSIKDLIMSVQLWQSHLKRIQGHFGSGVVSYFIFLRWLFILNFSISILLVCFIVTPQVVWWHEDENSTINRYVNTTKFSGIELLTGADMFTDTVTYYGHYTNTTITAFSGVQYNMPYAYLFVNGIIFFICFILLSYSLAKSYRVNYIDTSGEIKNIFSTKVFCSWDYSIETMDAATLKSRSIYNEFKELLSAGQKSMVVEEWGSTLFRIVLIILVNSFVLSCIAGICFFVYYYLEDKINKALESDIEVLREMMLSLIITIIVFVVPMIFSLVAKAEWYYSRQTRLYITMIRVVLLKIAILGVLVYFWLFAQKSLEYNKCWETQLGQEIYRLFGVDFVFLIAFSTIFLEAIRYFIHKFCCTLLGSPEFGIDHNTLQVIYLQSLTWVGTFYCPMLPVMMTFTLFILFYVKRISVMNFCCPPMKPWRAVHMQTLFLGLTFINFLLAAFATGYSIFVIKPSSMCGPFQTLTTCYDVILNLLVHEGGLTWWKKFTHYLKSPAVISGVLLFMCVVVYYLRARAHAWQDMVTLIREQLIMEGRDKVFLLQLFDKAMEQKIGGMEQNTGKSGSSSSDSSPKGFFANSYGHKRSRFKGTKSREPQQQGQINQIYRDHSRHLPDKKDSHSPTVHPKGYNPGYMKAEVPVNETVSNEGAGDFHSQGNYKPGWGKQRQLSHEFEEIMPLPDKLSSPYGSTTQLDGVRNLKQNGTRPGSPLRNADRMGVQGKNTPRSSIESLPFSVHQQGFQHLIRGEDPPRSHSPASTRDFSPSRR